MSTIAKLFLLLLVVVLISACSKPASSVSTTDNPSFENEILFTDGDGYTIHRFTDAGASHYYVTPGPATVHETHHTGKATYHLEVPTAK